MQLNQTWGMQMSEEWYVGLIVSWLPFVVFCFLSWWVGLQIRHGLVTKDGRSLADVLEDLFRELQQSNSSKQ